MIPSQFYRLSNGCYVRSSFEVKFANFLIHNDIAFKVDQLIDDKSSKKYRYDFLIYNKFSEPVYFEIWGLDNHSIHQLVYNKKKKAKKSFYRRRSLKLINISSRKFTSLNFKDLQKFFIKIFKENNIKLNNFKTLSSAELLKADNESAWTEEKVFQDYKSICLENGNQPLSGGTLKAKGHGGLALAIFKYYPGCKVQLDKDLGYQNMQSPEFSLSDIKKIMKDLVIANNGVPLLGTELEAMGHRPMVRSISFHYNSSLTKIYAEIGFGAEYESLIYQGKTFRARERSKFLKENGLKIIKDYEKYGRNEAAKIWKVSVSCMSRWMKRLKVITKHKKLTNNKNQVFKDYSELGVKITSEKYNVHPSTIRRLIKKNFRSKIKL